MIFTRLRERLPQDSVFRIPLVFHLSWVLLLKLVLLTLLWQLAFKPLLAHQQPQVDQQLGVAEAAHQSSSSVTPSLKDVNHD